MYLSMIVIMHVDTFASFWSHVISSNYLFFSDTSAETIQK